MTTTIKRAAKGGEFGANGEWYEGGKFINTVPENKKREGSTPARKVGKQEVAPYVWEMAPEGKMSIFRRIAGVVAKHVNGVMVPAYNAQILSYVGMSSVEADNLINLWNAGERWL